MLPTSFSCWTVLCVVCYYGKGQIYSSQILRRFDPAVIDTISKRVMIVGKWDFRFCLQQYVPVLFKYTLLGLAEELSELSVDSVRVAKVYCRVVLIFTSKRCKIGHHLFALLVWLSACTVLRAVRNVWITENLFSRFNSEIDVLRHKLIILRRCDPPR